MFDLEDARRLARELDPSVAATELEARAAEILAGRLLVIRRDAPLALDGPSPEQAPLLCSLLEVR